MLRKKDLYDKVVSLRREGLSYNEIKAFVSVGHGTISRWCSNIKLTEEQEERIRNKKVNSSFIRILKEKAQKDKENAERWAKEKFNKLKLDYNDLLISGIMLYWAEGYNSNKNCSAIFTNTDANMVKIMMKFFREIIGVSDNKIKIMVRLDERGNIKEAREYWSEITNLPMERFQNSEILKMQKNSQSLVRHPNGICRISVYDVSTRRKIDNLIGLCKRMMSPRSSEDRAVHS